MKDIEITFVIENASRRRRSSETPKTNVSVTFYSIDDSVTTVSATELTETIELSVETGLQSYEGTIIDSSETPTVTVQDQQGKCEFYGFHISFHVKITFICKNFKMKCITYQNI